MGAPQTPSLPHCEQSLDLRSAMPSWHSLPESTAPCNTVDNAVTDVVNKLWSLCHTLRHDGVDYGDYVEQITYLLFLKMVDEVGGVRLPKGCSWPVLIDETNDQLIPRYRKVLGELSQADDLLGDIFAGAQSRIKNPVSLRKLLDLIDEMEWTGLDVDVQADAYEGLLERAADEGKKGAGQYFTPRAAIRSIVRCVKPDPRTSSQFTICDPACGTAGFLVAAYEWFADELPKQGNTHARTSLRRRLRKSTYFGEELVAGPRRLGLMNLYLHGIEGSIRLRDAIYSPPLDERFDVVLTNPPFGTKGAGEIPQRPDFVLPTSNKQLNFLQHVVTILKDSGRAAMVLPDSCLFAGDAGELFAHITGFCDVHTVLRLPQGTFSPYSNGVRANVLFFTKGRPTHRTWIYDLRIGIPPITKKERPLTHAHFEEFERCYGDDPDGRARRRASDSSEGRWRSFRRSELKKHDYNFDRLMWMSENSDPGDDYDIASPSLITERILASLELAASETARLLASLEKEKRAP